MAYYDTLEYVDASDVTHEVALKSSNLSANGGAIHLRFSPASHGIGTFTIDWAEPPETGIEIPFKSRCKIRVNRASADGAADSFSGGTILFQGRRTDSHGGASGSQVYSTITLSDAWWDLMQVTFQQGWKYISGGTIGSPTYSTQDFPDLILFQSQPGIIYNPVPVNLTINTFQQLQEIIRYAANYAAGDDAVEIQLAGSGTLTGDTWSAAAPEFTPCYAPWYQMRSGKCAEAIECCLRPHPQVWTEMDYSTTPPTLHVRNRAAMTAIDLPYKSTDADGVIHLASEIKPLPELVPDAVRLHYKITGSVNGSPTISYSLDAYPNSTNKLLCLDYSIDVAGADITVTQVQVNTAAFDAADLDTWRDKVKSLLQLSQGGQIPNDGDAGALAFVDANAYNASTHPQGIRVIADDGTDYSANYAAVLPYLCEESLYSWMKLSTGDAITAKAVTVSGFFSYQKKNPIGTSATANDKLREHQQTMRLVLTDAPSDTYTLRQVTAVAESVPTGLAQSIWTELQTLQYKLQHEIFQVAVDDHSLPVLVKPGLHKINLVGGHSDWETMDAIPESVEIELFRTADNKLAARTRISCGPVNHLEPGYLIQLMNLFQNRSRAGIDPGQRLGQQASSTVDLTASLGKENSLPANPVPEISNHLSPFTPP